MLIVPKSETRVLVEKTYPGGNRVVLAFPPGTDGFAVLEKVIALMPGPALPPEEVARREQAYQNMLRERRGEAPIYSSVAQNAIAAPTPFAPEDKFHAPTRAVSMFDAPAPVRASAPAPVAPRPHPVGIVRDTSMEAYRDLEASGKLSDQQKVVAAYFFANPKTRFTRQELARDLSLGINVICGRVNELLREPLGVLRETGRKTCSVTKRDVNALGINA